jgi:hypothetical protein
VPWAGYFAPLGGRAFVPRVALDDARDDLLTFAVFPHEVWRLASSRQRPEPARELMHRMGHASMRAALIYQHATSERDREIADNIDKRLAGERAEQAAKPKRPRRRKDDGEDPDDGAAGVPATSANGPLMAVRSWLGLSLPGWSCRAGTSVPKLGISPNGEVG